MQLTLKHILVKHHKVEEKSKMSLKDKLYYFTKDFLFVLHGAVMIGSVYLILLELNISIDIHSIGGSVNQWISNSINL